MKRINKELIRAREKMIETFIAEANKGRIQSETVREELKHELDLTRAAFLSAAADFRASYEEDLQKAIDALSGISEELNKVERQVEAVRGATPSAAEADPQYSERHETEIHVLETKIAELQGRKTTLLEYRPAGLPGLLEAAINAEGVWRAAKAAADKVTAGISANLRKKIRELEKEEREVRRGVWSSVEIPADCRISELRKIGKRSLTVSELIQQRTAAAEELAAINETVEQTRAALQASTVITNEDKDRSSDNEQ